MSFITDGIAIVLILGLIGSGCTETDPFRKCINDCVERYADTKPEFATDITGVYGYHEHPQVLKNKCYDYCVNTTGYGI